MLDWTGAYSTPSRGRNPSTADVTATAPTPSWLNRIDPAGARASNPPRIGYRAADRFGIDRPLRATEAKERRPTAEQTDLQFVIPLESLARDRGCASELAPVEVAEPTRSSRIVFDHGCRERHALHRLDGPVETRVCVELHALSLRRAISTSLLGDALGGRHGIFVEQQGCAGGAGEFLRRAASGEGEAHLACELGQLVLHGEQSVGGHGRDDDERTLADRLASP